MERERAISPIKKNKRGSFVGCAERGIIINIYKSKIMKQANLPVEQQLKYKELIKLISEETGIGQRTISTTISEYKTKGTISSPNKKKIRPTIIEKLDSLDKNAIQQKVHELLLQKETPTLQNILSSINDDSNLPNFSRTSFCKILKDLNFIYNKETRSWHSPLSNVC